MNLLKKILSALFLVGTSITFAQTQYMYSKDLGMQDMATYQKNKDAYLQKIQKQYNNTNIKLDERTNLLRQTKDSIISTYLWALDFRSGNITNQNQEEANKKKKEELERLEKVLQQTELQTLNGKKITFNALKGKPVVLNFWFTKCAPCIEEMPALNELAAKYKDQAHFIAITYNNESEVTEFLTKHPFNFTQIVNEQSFIDKMEIKSYPRTFFIDKNGKIARQFPGLPFVIDPKTNERKTNIKPFENILIKMLE